MEKTSLEKRIEEKAAKRFDVQFRVTLKTLHGDPILSSLLIANTDKPLNLVSTGGTCFATDLFHCNNLKLLEESTNFLKVKAGLIEKYLAEETEHILNQIGILAQYIERNDDPG